MQRLCGLEVSGVKSYCYNHLALLEKAFTKLNACELEKALQALKSNKNIF